MTQREIISILYSNQPQAVVSSVIEKNSCLDRARKLAKIIRDLNDLEIDHEYVCVGDIREKLQYLKECEEKKSIYEDGIR